MIILHSYLKDTQTPVRTTSTATYGFVVYNTRRSVLSSVRLLVHFLFVFYFYAVARHTRPEGHYKVWAIIIFLPEDVATYIVLLGLKQG